MVILHSYKAEFFFSPEEFQNQLLISSFIPRVILSEKLECINSLVAQPS